MIDVDYHTHTVYSHGTGSIRDNVEEAIRKGLKKIAICDHGPSHYLYGVKEHEIMKMRREIDELQKEYEGRIEILLGLEANIIGFDGTIDVNDRILSVLDVLLVGYHYGITPKSFKDFIGFYIMNPITKILPIGRKKAMRLNTMAFVNAINRYDIDMITHPGSKAKVDIGLLAREAGKVGTALEINSKHSELSIESIEIAKKENVDFILGSDAHDPSRVGEVSKSMERAKAAGLTTDRILNYRKGV